MNIQQISINDLKPYPQNAKKHPAEQVEHIANSIREFGFQQPIVVDKDNVVVIGHGRLLAAKKLNMDSVPCVRADDLTDEQIKALRLADNKTNESKWDFDLLDMELSDIEIDMEQFGFDLDIDDEPQEVVEDEVPEEVETRCKIGDLWQLGDHKLICGDSTDPAVIDRLMDGVKAKLLLTDPPYGINAVHKDGKVHGDSNNGIIKNTKVYEPIIGDDTTDTAKANYDVALTCTENQIIFGGNYFTDFLPPSRCWIVWDKQNGEGSFADAELAWTSFDRVVKLYTFMWNGLIREGSREVEGKTRVHPTQKPVGMLADILKDFSEENDSILDCFGGSGSTLIACEQLNRKCYMAELDEKYCDVIIQRWENLTGGKAVCLSEK